MKKSLFAVGIALILLATPCVAFASELEDTIPETADVYPITDEPIWVDDSHEVIVKNESKPFLALGNDLTEEQLDYVLSEMGIKREELDNYRVVYITNDQEHQYLDSYIAPEVIGKRSLSCVMVKENEAGGIRVTTKNIDYCTVNMYKNALLTAGIQNADVLVVGPFPISGTAALIGAWQAYEEMSGEDISEARIDTALDEIVTVGELVNEIEGIDGVTVEDFISYVKAEVIANDLNSIEDIKDAIKEAETEYNITLTDEQQEEVAKVMQKIADLDIDPSVLLEQAGELYNKYGNTILSEAKDAINGILTDEVKASLWENIMNFFKTLFSAIKDYLSK
ncbi:MAG: DUF1002 domain-containing protein [Lachnospiraceae bacterium]|nr:DUF1002 domain-containing protein [Lachnospiraceae bacterium]